MSDRSEPEVIPADPQQADESAPHANPSGRENSPPAALRKRDFGDFGVRLTSIFRRLPAPPWRVLLNLVLNIAVPLALLTLAVVLSREIFRRTLVVEPISVPPILADQGYGPEVAARRLSDAIDRVLASVTQTAAEQNAPPGRAAQQSPAGETRSAQNPIASATGEQVPDIAPRAAFPVVVATGFGVSLESIAIAIGDSLDLGRRLTISGEFTGDRAGLQLLLRGNARVVFQNTAAGDPKDPDALLDQAAVSLIDATSPAVGAMVHNNLGDGYDRAGNRADAAAQYRAAIALEPDYARAHNGLGNVLGDLGKLDAAAAEYRTALALDRKFALPHNGLGNVFFDRGELAAAAEEYRTAIALDPNLTYPHNGLGNILNQRGRLDAAAAEYRTAITLDRSYGDPHNGLGNVLYSRDRLEEAAAEYRIAIALEPTSALPHNGLANVLRDQRQLDAAAAEYRTAIALDPEFALAHNGLGNVLFDRREANRAGAEYRKAIALDPRSALAHNGLGNVLLDQERPDAAAVEYRTAIGLDPKFALAHNGLGLALFEQGKPDPGVAEFRTAIVLDPKSALPHNNLGNLFLALGQPDTAAAEYRTAISLNPDIASAHYGLAVALLGQIRRTTPENTRLAVLETACKELGSAAGLAPVDRRIQAEMHSVSTLLPPGRHCPPE